jgi:hypothetical protein
MMEKTLENPPEFFSKRFTLILAGCFFDFALDHGRRISAAHGDLLGLDFLGLRPFEGQHAGIIPGFDRLRLDSRGQGQAAGEGAVAPLAQVVVCVLFLYLGG